MNRTTWTSTRHAWTQQLVTAMISKLDFVLVAACMIGGVIWIEQEHRTRIGLPAASEIATSRARAAGCPETDAAPYTASCLAFIGNSTGSGTHRLADPYDNDLSNDVPN